MSKRDSRQLRAIGHKLKPIVTVAGKGLTETVVQEIERALSDHELIKVKLVVGGPDARGQTTEEICAKTGAELIQSTGAVLLLLRRSKEQNPRLSNLIRHKL